MVAINYIANPGGCSSSAEGCHLRVNAKMPAPGSGSKCSSCVSPGGFLMLEISSEADEPC